MLNKIRFDVVELLGVKKRSFEKDKFLNIMMKLVEGFIYEA